MAFPKENRLKKKADFDRVFKEGKTVKSSLLFVKVLEGESLRLGISISSKAYGNASARNRVKRVISERIKGYNIRKKADILIVVSKKSSEPELVIELDKLLEKIL